jgi:raffinose/stachyose/melibiose transport system permease protein
MGGKRFRFKKNDIGGLLPNVILQIFLLAWAVLLLYPVFWMFYSTFKPSDEIRRHILAFPKSLYLENFKVFLYDPVSNIKALRINMGRYFLNSTIVSVTTIVILMVVATMAAYAIAKIRYPGSKAFLTMMIFLIGISEISIIVPLYYFMSKLKLLNQHFGLIFPYVAINIPFSVIVLQSYFRTFPNELIEAAYIDGASRTDTFLRVVIPMSQGAVVAVLIVAFLHLWNEFTLAFTLMRSERAKTISAGIMQFKGVYVSDYGPMFAGLLGAMAPTIIVYLIFHRALMKGMSAGAIKG